MCNYDMDIMFCDYKPYHDIAYTSQVMVWLKAPFNHTLLSQNLRHCADPHLFTISHILLSPCAIAFVYLC